MERLVTKVNCSNCNNDYKTWDAPPNSKQADGCNSEVHVSKDGRQLIYSHYGSNYDTMRHLVIKEEGIPSGTICDTCIKTMLENGSIQPDNNFNYWHDFSGLEL